MNNSRHFERYSAAIEELPASGGGLHAALLGASNHGALAGVEPSRIFSDLREATASGSKGRAVLDSEIKNAIDKAFKDYIQGGNPITYSPRAKPVISSEYAQNLIDRGRGLTGIDLIESSAVRLLNDSASDWRLLIETLFTEQDMILAGGLYDKRLYKQNELLNLTSPLEYICPNPFTGQTAQTKSGNDSFICDSAVREFRYCVIEFDNISLPEQVRFWAKIPLPITALIYSGGKSIHCWLNLTGINLSSLADWQAEVKGELFEKRLKPLGVDVATSNPSRTSRMPSYIRETNREQQLLYLNPSPSGEQVIKD
ncbi:MAG: hypothetical protein AB7F23_10135 [Phycisphaerae bacterium]